MKRIGGLVAALLPVIGIAQTAQFDVAATQLPPNFAGYDCAAISGKIKALKLAKDEYESKAAHADRIDAALSQPLIGRVTSNDTMVFVADVKPYEVRYDAETETMSLTKTFPSNVLTSEVMPGEVVSTLKRSTQEYVGTNAYGAKANVTAFDREVCAVGFRNLTSPRARLEPYRFSVKMDGPTAKGMKERLGFALIGVLANPYRGRYTQSTTATISSPTSLTVHGDAIIMRLDEVWLFDRSTGQVLGKAATPAAK